ncbi:TnsA endonuclease N-terminal domain-containing protein [Rugamonas sp. DEMB1]|uniref:TnsA endonuclease N-terminal domain-containing protein n=1 Tax=Rugamonas sp. DEMB1 TaxID=3039386 RepID=UPI002447DBF4|nr:TnsA endonuclease N-terminal domain-containing protein [Rugamonas sp. DEMB1]WGG50475.1 TnsA endonuclease N-terminal domain-containing protein [Rugamonas sp. DEMB1]
MRARRVKTQADVDRYIAEGFGAGEGNAYKPWLRVQDVPSRGRSRKVAGTKVNRIHQVLSDLEYQYLTVLEFSEQIIDIREQYPLFPTPEAQQIAAQLGIAYPRYPGTAVPYVMTTDFLITGIDAAGQQYTAAKTLKYDKELLEPKGLQRRLEKFELEQALLTAKGITNWGIVTDSMLGRTLTRNLEWLRQGSMPLQRHLAQHDVQLHFLDHLAYFASAERTLASVIRTVANAIRLPYSDAVTLFKHLVWQKAIMFDIRSVELQLVKACPSLRFINQSSGRKAA